MKRIVTTMTQRGQVTVPAEVRRLLGLKRGDKLEFAIEDGEVTVARPKYTIETVYGSVPPLGRDIDIDEAIESAKAEHAAKSMKKLGLK